MIELEPALIRRLKRLRVQIEEPDPDMVVLRDVPADRRCFSKARTNLLVRRTRPGMPCLVGVDEDLEYLGEDSGLIRLFASARRQQGWRVFFLSGEPWPGVVEQALGLLGFGASESAWQPGAEGREKGGLLGAFAVDLSRLVREGEAPPSVGRTDQIERVCASLMGWHGRLPLIVGESGVGKTNLLHAVARRLAESQSEMRLVLVNLGVLMAGALLESERENLVLTLLKEAAAAPHTLLALENLEQAVVNVPHGRFLLVQALEQGLGIAGTTLPGFLEQIVVAPLARRLDVIELGELDPGLAAEALEALREQIGSRHQVLITAAMAKAALERALPLAGFLPDKALALLDAAAARAALGGASEVELYHIYLAGADFREA